jgi:hypothetical protein
MFLAGMIIHSEATKRPIYIPLWRLWSFGGANQFPFKAYISKREDF